MGSDWGFSTLGELAEIVMGQSPKGTACNSDGNGTPLLNGPTEFGSYHPYPTQFTTDPKRFSKSGDLLFCVRGSTTGRMNWSDDDYAIGRGLAALRHRDGEEYQSFLRGVIDCKLPELLSSATGSTFPNVSKSQLNDLEVLIPPLSEQKAIAHILGSLDDKIELNRQMNQTLESMAQALFKSWFVDFDPVIDNALAAGNVIPDVFEKRAEARTNHRKKGGVVYKNPNKMAETDDFKHLFPSEFEFTEGMGWIPKGWGVTSLEKLATISSSKRIFAKEYEEEGIPFYRGKEISLLSKGINITPEIFITKNRFNEIKEKYGVPLAGDILLTSVGTIGNTYLVTEDDEFYFKDGNLTWFSQYVTNIKGQYLYTWLNTRQAFLAIEDIKIGSTQQAITISSLNKICLVQPKSSVIQLYNNFRKGNLDKKNILSKEIATLTKLRDTLLPKLLSGELRIPEAEKLVSEV